MQTDNNVAAQAGDEPMRAAFWKFVATLPIPMQDTISTSEARGESLTATAFASGYRVAQVSPRATADVEREKEIHTLRTWLSYALRQNECEMILTRKECRSISAILATTKPGA